MSLDCSKCQNSSETQTFDTNAKKDDPDKLYTRIYDNEKGRDGMDICLDKCKGNCVEYGIQGTAFCYED